jgi:hypothetical protein
MLSNGVHVNVGLRYNIPYTSICGILYLHTGILDWNIPLRNILIDKARTKKERNLNPMNAIHATVNGD